MKLHREELELAQAHSRANDFDGLTPLQMRNIQFRGRGLYRWFTGHQRAHALINLAVIVLLLLADLAALLWLPRWFFPAEGVMTTLWAALAAGGLHGWLIYSLSVFTIHEGAAHQLIFPPRNRVNRALAAVANNLCRLGGADPGSYVENHQSHHARFGTDRDGEFLNHVRPRRFWLSLMPWAIFINFSDFVVHRPLRPTRGHLVSMLTMMVYNGLCGWLMWRSFGLGFTALALAVVMPHAAFYLDRLRQFTEHNLMPLENKDGARSFGLGFWGMLIGGGPWGQPCHWMHHLAPQLPWYQQLILHRYVRRLLTADQRRQFLLAPVIGFPRLIRRLWQTA